MLARLSAFVIWGLVAATAVFWGLRLLVRAPAAPVYAVAVGDGTGARGDLTRLLGSAPVNAPLAAAAPEGSSRFRLLGIMAPKSFGGAAPAGHGVALIAVDGKMPKAYAVGARVDGNLVLQSVSLRTVSITSAKGAAPITLELPPPTAAATGTLPVGGAGAGYVPPLPPAVVQPYVAPPIIPQAAQQLAPPVPSPVRIEPNAPAPAQ